MIILGNIKRTMSIHLWQVFSYSLGIDSGKDQILQDFRPN